MCADIRHREARFVVWAGGRRSLGLALGQAEGFRMRRVLRIVLAVGWLLAAVVVAPQTAQANPCSTSFSDINTRMAAGNPVCLANNLTQTDFTSSGLNQLAVPAGVSTSIDLNGYSMTFTAADGYAGIRVPLTASLTIADSVGTGTLNVAGGERLNLTGAGAGIGGNGGAAASSGESVGTLTITGGNIDSTGGAGAGGFAAAAGIGGGGAGFQMTGPAVHGGIGGLVTISGGNVTATGGLGGAVTYQNGAGIGSGSSNDAAVSASGGTLVLQGTGTPATAGNGYSSGPAAIAGVAATVSTSPVAGVSFVQTGTDASSAASAGTTSIAFSADVTFDSAGGSAVSTQTVPWGGTAAAPVAPTRSGYNFAGWSLGGGSYSFSNLVLAPITLTASWTESGAGGTGNSGSGTTGVLAATGVSAFPFGAGALLALALGGVLLSVTRIRRS